MYVTHSVASQSVCNATLDVTDNIHCWRFLIMSVSTTEAELFMNNFLLLFLDCYLLSCSQFRLEKYHEIFSWLSLLISLRTTSENSFSFCLKAFVFSFLMWGGFSVSIFFSVFSENENVFHDVCFSWFLCMKLF